DGRVKFIVVANILSLIYLLGYAAVHLVGGQRYNLPVIFLIIPSLLVSMAYFGGMRHMKSRSFGVYGIAWLLVLWFIALNVAIPNVDLALDGPGRSQHLAAQVDSLRAVIPEGSSVASNALTESYSAAYILGIQSYGTIP